MTHFPAGGGGEGTVMLWTNDFVDIWASPRNWFCSFPPIPEPLRELHGDLVFAWLRFGQKMCRTKSFWMFRIFRPEFRSGIWPEFLEDSPCFVQQCVNSRGIAKTSGFTRGVCKNRWFFIKFKGFLVEFLENRRSWENQSPPENRQKSGGLFWASPSTMHLVCTLLICLIGNGNHSKIHLKSPQPHVRMPAKSPGKFKETFHKSCLESKQSNLGCELLQELLRERPRFPRVASRIALSLQEPFLFKSGDVPRPPALWTL